MRVNKDNLDDLIQLIGHAYKTKEDATAAAAILIKITPKLVEKYRKEEEEMEQLRMWIYQ